MKKKSRKRPAAAELDRAVNANLPKLPGDRIDDARTLIWEAQSLCNVGRAAYGDGDTLDVYNMLGAIERALDGAGNELAGLGKTS